MESMKRLRIQAVLPILLGIVSSGFIGMLVALPFIINRSDLTAGLIRSSAVGMTIALSGTLAFGLIFRNVRSRTLWALLLMAVIIAVGTTSGALLFAFKAFYPILFMVILAEVTGLTLTYGMYRYSTRLNEQLMRVQEKIKNQTH